MKSLLTEFVEKYSLKEKALSGVNIVLDSTLEVDKEYPGEDSLEGNDRSDLIFEFKNFGLLVDKYGGCTIETRINIYSKKLYGPHADIPIGHYIEVTDLDGQHLDEFLFFDWSHLSLNVDYHINQIHSVIPQRYFDTNAVEYEFVACINLLIFLAKGKKFDLIIPLVKRCLDYVEEHEYERIDKRYLDKCMNLYRSIYHFVNNHNLVEASILSESRIKERLYQKK